MESGDTSRVLSSGRAKPIMETRNERLRLPTDRGRILPSLSFWIPFPDSFQILGRSQRKETPLDCILLLVEANGFFIIEKNNFVFQKTCFGDSISSKTTSH